MMVGFCFFGISEFMSTDGVSLPRRFMYFVAIIGALWYFFLVQSSNFVKHFKRLQVGCGLMGWVLVLTFDIALKRDGAILTALFPLVFTVLLKIPFFESFLLNLIVLFMFLVRYLAFDVDNRMVLSDEYRQRECEVLPDRVCRVFDYLSTLFGLIVIFSYGGRSQEFYNRQQFDLQSALEKAEQRSREILHNILPPFVVEKMLASSVSRGPPVVAEDIGLVTVVFCDIQNFSELVLQMDVDPGRLVQVLDTLFKRYDRLCEVHGVTKIETVGETFLSARGVSLSDTGKVRNTRAFRRASNRLMALNRLKKDRNGNSGGALENGNPNGSSLTGASAENTATAKSITDAAADGGRGGNTALALTLANKSGKNANAPSENRANSKTPRGSPSVATSATTSEGLLKSSPSVIDTFVEGSTNTTKTTLSTRALFPSYSKTAGSLLNALPGARGMSGTSGQGSRSPSFIPFSSQGGTSSGRAVAGGGFQPSLSIRSFFPFSPTPSSPSGLFRPPLGSAPPTLLQEDSENGGGTSTTPAIFNMPFPSPSAPTAGSGTTMATGGPGNNATADSNQVQGGKLVTQHGSTTSGAGSKQVQGGKLVSHKNDNNNLASIPSPTTPASPADGTGILDSPLSPHHDYAAKDAYRSLLFACEQIRVSRNIFLRNNVETGAPEFLQVKIGLNTGRVIAGIVGSRKPQYALFGDTVNTASRMKGKSEADKIHLSQSTYDWVCLHMGGREELEKIFVFEERELEVKGKGLMRTYLLHGLVNHQPETTVVDRGAVVAVNMDRVAATGGRGSWNGTSSPQKIKPAEQERRKSADDVVGRSSGAGSGGTKTTSTSAGGGAAGSSSSTIVGGRDTKTIDIGEKWVSGRIDLEKEQEDFLDKRIKNLPAQSMPLSALRGISTTSGSDEKEDAADDEKKQEQEDEDAGSRKAQGEQQNKKVIGKASPSKNRINQEEGGIEVDKRTPGSEDSRSHLLWTKSKPEPASLPQPPAPIELIKDRQRSGESSVGSMLNGDDDDDEEGDASGDAGGGDEDEEAEESGANKINIIAVGAVGNIMEYIEDFHQQNDPGGAGITGSKGLGADDVSGAGNLQGGGGALALAAAGGISGNVAGAKPEGGYTVVFVDENGLLTVEYPPPAVQPMRSVTVQFLPGRSSGHSGPLSQAAKAALTTASSSSNARTTTSSDINKISKMKTSERNQMSHRRTSATGGGGAARRGSNNTGSRQSARADVKRHSSNNSSKPRGRASLLSFTTGLGRRVSSGDDEPTSPSPRRASRTHSTRRRRTTKRVSTRASMTASVRQNSTVRSMTSFWGTARTSITRRTTDVASTFAGVALSLRIVRRGTSLGQSRVALDHWQFSDAMALIADAFVNSFRDHLYCCKRSRRPQASTFILSDLSETGVRRWGPDGVSGVEGGLSSSSSSSRSRSIIMGRGNGTGTRAAAGGFNQNGEDQDRFRYAQEQSSGGILDRLGRVCDGIIDVLPLASLGGGSGEEEGGQRTTTGKDMLKSVRRSWGKFAQRLGRTAILMRRRRTRSSDLDEQEDFQEQGSSPRGTGRDHSPSSGELRGRSGMRDRSRLLKSNRGGKSSEAGRSRSPMSGGATGSGKSRSGHDRGGVLAQQSGAKSSGEHGGPVDIFLKIRMEFWLSFKDFALEKRYVEQWYGDENRFRNLLTYLSFFVLIYLMTSIPLLLLPQNPPIDVTRAVVWRIAFLVAALIMFGFIRRRVAIIQEQKHDQLRSRVRASREDGNSNKMLISTSEALHQSGKHQSTKDPSKHKRKQGPFSSSTGRKGASQTGSTSGRSTGIERSGSSWLHDSALRHTWHRAIDSLRRQTNIFFAPLKRTGFGFGALDEHENEQEDAEDGREAHPSAYMTTFLGFFRNSNRGSTTGRDTMRTSATSGTTRTTNGLVQSKDISDDSAAPGNSFSLGSGFSATSSNVDDGRDSYGRRNHCASSCPCLIRSILGCFHEVALSLTSCCRPRGRRRSHSLFLGGFAFDDEDDGVNQSKRGVMNKSKRLIGAEAVLAVAAKDPGVSIPLDAFRRQRSIGNADKKKLPISASSSPIRDVASNAATKSRVFVGRTASDETSPDAKVNLMRIGPTLTPAAAGSSGDKIAASATPRSVASALVSRVALASTRPPDLVRDRSGGSSSSREEKTKEGDHRDMRLMELKSTKMTTVVNKKIDETQELEGKNDLRDCERNHGPQGESGKLLVLKPPGGPPLSDQPEDSDEEKSDSSFSAFSSSDDDEECVDPFEDMDRQRAFAMWFYGATDSGFGGGSRAGGGDSNLHLDSSSNARGGDLRGTNNKHNKSSNFGGAGAHQSVPVSQHAGKKSSAEQRNQDRHRGVASIIQKVNIESAPLSGGAIVATESDHDVDRQNQSETEANTARNGASASASSGDEHDHTSSRVYPPAHRGTNSSSSPQRTPSTVTFPASVLSSQAGSMFRHVKDRLMKSPGADISSRIDAELERAASPGKNSDCADLEVGSAADSVGSSGGEQPHPPASDASTVMWNNGHQMKDPSFITTTGSRGVYTNELRSLGSFLHSHFRSPSPLKRLTGQMPEQSPSLVAIDEERQTAGHGGNMEQGSFGGGGAGGGGRQASASSSNSRPTSGGFGKTWSAMWRLRSPGGSAVGVAQKQSSLRPAIQATSTLNSAPSPATSTNCLVAPSPLSSAGGAGYSTASGSASGAEHHMGGGYSPLSTPGAGGSGGAPSPGGTNKHFGNGIRATTSVSSKSSSSSFGGGANSVTTTALSIAIPKTLSERTSRVSRTVSRVVSRPVSNFVTVLGKMVIVLIGGTLALVFAVPVMYGRRVYAFLRSSLREAVKRTRLQWNAQNVGITFLLAFFYSVGLLNHILSPLYVTANEDGQHWLTYAFGMELMLWIALLSTGSGLLLYPLLLWVNVALFSVFGALCIFSYQATSLWRMEIAQFVAAFIFMNLLGAYSREQFSRLVFVKLADLSRTEKRSDQLLKEMLPSYLLQDFRLSGGASLKVVREYQKMTCLFADISGFTAYSQKVSAFKVVQLVTRLFSAIDDLSRRVGVYKVCTIGDCYVATLEPQVDYTEEQLAAGCSDMFKFAAGLIFLVRGLRDDLQIEGLGMRVGLHLGTFVGGVIGQRKLRYDIWGVDVLVTNKMESSGQPGQICASATLKEYTEITFPKRFKWTPHKYDEEYEMQVYRLLKDRSLSWAGGGGGGAESANGGKHRDRTG
ncbi:unnamed protein product [Amoebophrya sp. A25]|nr:unnamed protein product [Amoebophrya sp. A25]|eukprot:GSA25T00005010001.1